MFQQILKVYLVLMEYLHSLNQELNAIESIYCDMNSYNHQSRENLFKKENLHFRKMRLNGRPNVAS